MRFQVSDPILETDKATGIWSLGVSTPKSGLQGVRDHAFTEREKR
jgi:hypothetical protein